MRGWLLDRLILEPSRERLEVPESLTRHELCWDDRVAELWELQPRESSAGVTRSNPKSAVPLVVLKFPGTSGRAETMGAMPLSLFPEVEGVVLGVNPPGYGATSRRASLRDSRGLNRAISQWLAARYPDSPLLVMGNSLGCVRSLAFAGEYGCNSLVLRNPPPLPELLESIARRRGSAMLGRWLARGLSSDWNAVALAKRVSQPVLFVQSERDALVLPELQDLIFESLAGPKQKLVLRACDHADPIPEDQQESYAQALAELFAACKKENPGRRSD